MNDKKPAPLIIDPSKDPRSQKKFLRPLLSLSVLIITVGAIYFLAFPKSVTKAPSAQNVIEDIEPIDPLAEKCNSNTVKGFGKVSRSQDIVVYSTECITKLYPDNFTDSLIRFYIRDATGTFNRRLYSVFNTRDIQKGSGTWAELPGIRQNLIEIHRVAGEEDKIFVNLSGQVVQNPSELERDDSAYNLMLSPNGQNIAFTRSNGDAMTKIEVVNVQTGQSKVYEFPEVGLNGVSPVAWSKDSKTLYVSGGIYEFYAPAQLWQINMATQKISKYQGIEGYDYPSPVFPEDDVALMSNQSNSGNSINLGEENPKPKDKTLFALSLSTGKISQVVTENAVYALGDMFRIGSYYIYSKYSTGDQASIKYKKLDLATKTSIALPNLDGMSFTAYSGDEGWLAGHDGKGQYVIRFLDSKNQAIMGKSSSEQGSRVPTDNTEYISRIVGVIKAEK